MSLTNVYRLIRFLIVIIVIISFLFIAFFVAKYTYPFIIALILAFMIRPLVDILETRANVPRQLAVFAAIMFLLVVITGTITFLVIELIKGTTYLAEHIPTHFKILVIFFQSFITNEIIPIYQRFASLISTLDPSQQTTILNNIQRIGEEIATTGANIIQQVLQQIPSTLGKLPNYISVLIFSLLGTFFITKDWYKLKTLINNSLPNHLTESGGNVVTGLKQALFGFVKAQLTLIMITALIVLVGLIILRVDYAITIAIITGLIDLLPYLGTGLVFIPWILYVFFSGNYFLTIGLSLLYVTIVVQRQIMEPKILSSNIGLNPLATLIALFAGFQLWGFIGLIAGPVSLVVINTLYQTGIVNQVWNYIKGDNTLK
ncbi:sporulation integral membrane protein YtvI [Aquibacillus halophilus]|uniref:Sporulation integral membrane protein YtvI n=1 Tax=Aquibacillus halophilus TaxID=930132 RepID=A0A6A8DGA8_9BACI|nr:sporulation integral membrane protein YtvI [Aquibacillus halophilus]MRH42879.1 sporulation integral membrane protein YtvI [Aquibacillus halophilus]